MDTTTVIMVKKRTASHKPSAIHQLTITVAIIIRRTNIQTPVVMLPSHSMQMVVALDMTTAVMEMSWTASRRPSVIHRLTITAAMVTQRTSTQTHAVISGSQSMEMDVAQGLNTVFTVMKLFAIQKKFVILRRLTTAQITIL